MRNENLMWAIIEQINWAERSQERRGYENGKLFLMENHTPATCEALSKFVAEKRVELSIRVDEYENDNGVRCGDYGGDDSYGDMLHHVIGLGQKAYGMITADPTLLNRIKYVESFSYCLPYSDDWEMLDANKHEDRARAAVNVLHEILMNNKPSSGDVLIIREIMGRMLLAWSGDFAGAVEDFDVDGELYNRYCDFEANKDHYALFANYLADIKRYMA